MVKLGYTAGMLDVSAGIGVDYKSYERSGDNSSFKESQQLDKLYLKGEFARDLYFRRLGDIYLKFDLAKYNLNSYEGKNETLYFPFIAKDNASKSDYFLHDIKSKITLNIPKLDVKLLIEYDEKTDFSINDRDYFTKIGKMNDDIESLKGLSKSLNDRDWQRNQNYFISRDGSVSFMVNYNKYEYDKRFEVSNYLKEEEIFKYGLDIKRIVGFYIEDNSKQFSTGKSNESNTKYKLGTIDYFGNDRTYSWKNVKLRAYYQLDSSEYDSREFQNKYGILGVKYEINKNKSVGLEYQHKDNYDKYTSDYEKSDKLKGKFEHLSNEINYYLSLTSSKVKNIYPSNENLNLTFDEINNLLSGQINGKGKITIKTINANLLNLNLILDGNTVNQNVLVTTGNDYVIEFNKSVKGSISNLSGDKNDLTFVLYREYGGVINRDSKRFETGYYFKKLDYFKSKLDISYEYVNVYATDFKRDYYDEEQLSLYKIFEIRPYNLIFDKSLKYVKYKEGADSYTDLVLSSSDGYFSKKLKLFLKSELWKRGSEGVYDDLDFWKESIIFDYLSEDLELSFIPSVASEKTGDELEKNTVRYEGKIYYLKNRLSFQYNKERNDNLVDKKRDEYITKNLLYKYEFNNITLNFEYLYNKINSIFESYSPSLTYVLYKIFPQNEPYLVFDVGAKLEKTTMRDFSNNEDYFFIKLTYRPTNRLESIFSYEKSMIKNNLNPDSKGDDYEFILNFKTKVFKLSLGYRNNKVFYKNERRDENVVYFKIDKSFNYAARVK